MNTYRVTLRVQGGCVKRYDVDACLPGPAINRALSNLTSTRTADVDVSCRLLDVDVKRHYSERKVRAI